MPTSAPDTIRISPAHLSTIAELVTMRFPLRAPEAKRVTRVRGVIAAAGELNRALATYAQHALVHCHGSAGTSDLLADTERLDKALRAFGAEVEAVAREYHEAVNRTRGVSSDAAERPASAGGDFMPWRPPAEGILTA